MVKICQHCQVESANTAYLCKGCGRVLRDFESISSADLTNPPDSDGDILDSSAGSLDEELDIEAEYLGQRSDGHSIQPRFVAPPVLKKKNPVLRRVVILGSVWVLALVSTVFLYVNSMERADYYTMGEDRIPSVKKVLGSRHLYDWRGGSHDWSWRFDLVYRVPREPNKDMETYVAYLVAHEGFHVIESADFEEDSGVVVLWRESKSRLEDVTIRIQFHKGGYAIGLLKNRDSLGGLSSVPPPEPGSGGSVTIDPVDGWTRVEGTQDLEYTSDKGFLRIGVRFIPTTMMTAEDYVHSVRQLAQTSPVDRVSVTETTKVTVAGFDGWQFFMTIGVVETRETFLLNGPWIYRVSCMLTSKSSESDYDQCTTMMDSLTVS